MQTIVETPGFIKACQAIFSEAEREQIVTLIAADPECGEVMPGTGGFRKVRFGRGGIGKSGGARVIYILRSAAFPVFLITAYAKSDKGNLTMQERNELRKLADTVFNNYRG